MRRGESVEGSPGALVKARLLGAGLAILALGLGWIGVAGIVRAAHALSTHAPIFAFDPQDARVLPICAAMLLMTPLCVLAAPAPDRATRKRAKPKRDWAALMMGAAILCVFLSFVAPLAADAIVAYLAHRNGYVACPQPLDERRGPQRWAQVTRDPGKLPCPLSWREAEKMGV